MPDHSRPWTGGEPQGLPPYNPPQNVNLNITIALSPETATLLHGLNSGILAAITDLKETIMATLDDITADMTEETTAIGGISTLVQGLRQQLADALSGTTLPPAVQAKVDAIFTAAEANKGALAAALAANTPAG